jgi:hypothetical protein
MPKAVDAEAALQEVLSALKGLSDPERAWVLQSATNRWNLTLQVLPAAPPPGAPQPGQPPRSNLPAGQTTALGTVRAFIRAKNPRSDVELVACLVYFLARAMSKPGFTTKEITQAHTDSGTPAINMHRALDNATRGSKFLASLLGGKEKQVTTLGEDVVEALPDRTAVAAAIAASGNRRKRKGRAKKAKK